MKTKITLLILSVLVLIIKYSDAQFTIQDDTTFKTAEQMLLANELFESGEPWAEELGYDLDLLDPSVPNAPDSISYSMGIESYEYSRYLLGTVISRSGLGLHIMWAPMITQMAAMEPAGFDGMYTNGMVNGFNEDDELMKTIMHFGMLANQMAPANPFPQFAEFESGNMHLPQVVAPNFSMDFSSLRWDRSKMNKTFNPAAMGQTMLKQYFWAQDMLGAFHDSLDNGIDADGVLSPDSLNSPHFNPGNNVFYGGNNLDGFIGQVLTAESINKALFISGQLAFDGNNLGMVNPATYDPANGIQYFPHRIGLTEQIKDSNLPPALDSLWVVDSSSSLFDQLSLLWATLSFKNMMDLSNTNPDHLAYHEVFDGDPFPAPMSVTGMAGPFDLMMGMSKVVFLNLMTMHFNSSEGTFVDVSGLDGSGTVTPGNEISAMNAAYMLVVLSKVAEEFAGTPLETMANDALNAQTNFILSQLKNPAGGFYNTYTIGTGASTDPLSLISLSSIIRGLYASHQATGDANTLQEADAAYNYLINAFYIPSAQVFKTTETSDEIVYNPLALASLSGALREANLDGAHSEASNIYARVFKSVYNKMLLTEAEASGESGNDSDGDNIPYIVGTNYPFVFAAEGKFNDVNAIDETQATVLNSEIQLYPNPASESSKITFETNTYSKVNVGVFNLTGKLILSYDSEYYSPGTQEININTTGLISNLYFVRLTINNEVRDVKKLLVHQNR